MEITSTTLILIGVVCIVLGFIASVLLNTLREEDAQGAVDEVQAPPGGKKGRYIPIVRLWREKKTGSLVVEMEGRSFVSTAPLSDAQREEMERIAREFRSWLGMGLSITTDQSRLLGQQVVESGTIDGSSREGTGVAAASTPPAVAPFTSSPAMGNEIKERKPAQVSVGQNPNVLASPPAVGTKSIVMQIEDILQDLLVTSPLASRVIHLTEDPFRGVLVSVGSDQFEGIDSVPDPAVKAIIRSAVTQWEGKQ